MPTHDPNDARTTRAREPRPAPADELEVPGWVAPGPPALSRRPPMRRTPRRRAAARERSRARAIAGCAVLGAVVTSAASLLGGLPLTPPGDGARGGVAALGPPNQEQPSSLAITADSGPFHPVQFDGEIDYGDAGAKFGASRYGHSHEGQDVFGESGTPLIAVRDGVVVDKGNDGGRGNYVGIHSPSEGETYVYLHMLRPTWLKPGEEVAAGTQVGAMGCTGSCYGTHLHFEVRRGDDVEAKPIDPLPLLEQWPQAPE